MTTRTGSTTEHLRDEVRIALERAFATRFVWTVRTPALLMTSAMRVVVQVLRERNGRYVFHVSDAQREFLESGPTDRGTSGAFVALACGGADAVLAIPYRDLLQWAGTHRTKHAMAVRRLGDRFALAGAAHIDLNRYRVRPA